VRFEETRGARFEKDRPRFEQDRQRKFEKDRPRFEQDRQRKIDLGPPCVSKKRAGLGLSKIDSAR
jgi:hypothetical protein